MSRRDTGFPDEVKALVLMRSDGRCEACGERTGDLQYHHRRARGMGSTRRPDTNTASNCLLVCLLDHAEIESHRAISYDRGHLVRSMQSPIAIPVLYRAANGCCWMTTATRIPCRLRLMGGRRDCRSVMRGVRPRSRLHPEIRIP